jgi:hypothetical protein
MATVPGTPMDQMPDPYGGIPRELRPDMTHILMAASMHAQGQKLAGDVLRFPSPAAAQGLSYLNKSEAERLRSQTRETLGRALGGGPSTVLPITPPTPGKEE